MDKRFKLGYLFDIYGGLLTQKQQSIVNMYLNEDLSLSEIAKIDNISRQAAFDLLKRSEGVLLNYDEKLKLFDRYIKNRELLEELKTCVDKNVDALSLIDKLMDNI